MEKGHSQEHHAQGRHRPYLRLAVMTILSFVVMYGLMYAMVDKASSIRPNLNQAYMAGLMTAPMVVLELLLMSMMYPKTRLNHALIGAGLVLGLVCFVAIRQQWLIGDREFLRSMIPHHSGAILMCGKAPVRDPQIRALCAAIIKGQQAEIDQMDAMLAKGAR
ncbi:DUF305 domain-containing protein [Caulobacter rhizosphaerae]|jgi:hypothetical protein|uniref:DUF305 domain-containing protein n=1 Tax=Caulobacter rhizosphaerae TaxID=2010972 RepID=A0ABU1MV70_9CAUL|nr:DUF305 domain-containing protein [Caulobacter rhizosphaerae]MDR6530088.1 hypothetical protein [Caulobacter rhizosphaerae]GGL44552.1 hypothetical protein GCM10010983_47340 [Caulobacter rhizosphaerae]